MIVISHPDDRPGARGDGSVETKRLAALARVANELADVEHSLEAPPPSFDPSAGVSSRSKIRPVQVPAGTLRAGLRHHSRILIVDDDDGIRDALRELLEAEGFDVAAVSDGQQALESLRHAPQAPCLVLLDLMMPVMDGQTFLSIKQRDPALDEVPVIVMTAGGDCATLRRLYEIRDCISKPISFDLLMTALQPFA